MGKFLSQWYYIFCCVSLLIVFNKSFCQEEGPSKITWDEYVKLNWSDFKGKVPYNSDLDAETVVNITISWQCYDGKLIYNIKAEFLSKNSWVKQEKRDDDLLMHERGHFDLNEIYARKMKKALTELKEPCSMEIAEINKIINDLSTEFDDKLQKYDVESKHGTDLEIQKKWDLSIKKQLKDLKVFK